MDPRLGSFLKGRYRPTEVIGRGGMGYVYRARDEALGRDVAIKLFAAATDPIEIRRQEHEVNLLAGLSHYSLVTLLDAAVDRSDPDDPRIYFVMELVAGDDLARLLDRRSLSARQVAQLGFDLAEGLQYIHRRGVVHRDLKPSNVLMLDYDDDSTRTRAKLTDFGIALTARSARITGAGMTTGTAAYLSPEQAQKSPVGPPSDIYSLGLVLLECFTGRLAFPGDPIPSALARLLGDPSIPDDLAPEWRELLAAMTARHPDDRPTADEVVAALAQLLASESGRHRHGFSGSGLTLDRNSVLHDVADRVVSIAGRALNAGVAALTTGALEQIWVSPELGLRESDVVRLLASPTVERPDLSCSLAATILGAGGDVVGTLEVFGDARLGSSDEQVATFTDLAALVAGALGTPVRIRPAQTSETPNRAGNVTALNSRRAARREPRWDEIPARG
ncbi:serine/threonine-protein kinase [Lacisediminihabitans changchengi]|uniref:Serine/threonine protein kinase n=1 Tax=Lacisediminihabitans changchengi TaxID=2787634 RepID=A0A934SLU2_9MICO|nr:serine/threonine-protein kinase [Lacisediminihabitans changchengi]MBK4347724.1 serine/threonine protein kinase [Lacisediminihabitans changchengi]